MAVKDAFDRIFDSKKRILVVMAHPDDAEIFCGGMTARLIDAGKNVRVVKMTFGERGSQQNEITEKELRGVRQKENIKAMEVLGVTKEDNVYLGIRDGAVENDLETIGKLVREIRLFKPDLIVTHNPQDVVVRFDEDTSWVNHRDHRNTGVCALDAAYPYARDLLFFPEHFAEDGIDSHVTSEFLLVDYYDHHDLVYIDVTDYIEFRTHSSQYDLGQVQDSTDFFTKHPSGRRYERFRYVIAD